MSILYQTNGVSFGSGGTGGGTTDAVARVASTANSVDIAALELAQVTQDALIDAKATTIEVAAIKAIQDAEDPYKAFARQSDGSIDWERESGAVGTIAAPVSVAVETDPIYVADKPDIALKTELHDGDAQDVSIAANAVAIAAEIAETDLEQAAQDAAIALKADQTALDAEVVRATAAELTKEPLLPTGASKFVQRNAADDGWDAVDLDINPSNLVSGPGTPGATDGGDDFYYIQLDAALGTNDIWGPKAGGAWPAQADFKSADPETGAITDFGDAVEGPKPKAWSADTLEEKFLFRPVPLPATGATIVINAWYQGREGSYTIPNGTVDGDFVLIDNTSNLKGESTRPMFAGKYATSSDGSIVSSTFSVSPNSRWRLYWDTALDGGAGAWRIHSNRSLIIPLTSADNDILLTRNNDYSVYNATGMAQTLKVPATPSGRIRIRYDALSTGSIRIEMETPANDDNLSHSDTVNSFYEFGVEYKGKEISIESNLSFGPAGGTWIIYVEDPVVPILDTLTLVTSEGPTFTGGLTDLQLYDETNAPYDMASFVVISDTGGVGGTIATGATIDNQNIGASNNSTRTIVLRSTSNIVRRGLNGYDRIATTGAIDNIVASYVGGAARTHTSAVAGGGAVNVPVTPPMDFYTRAELTDNPTVDIEYIQPSTAGETNNVTTDDTFLWKATATNGTITQGEVYIIQPRANRAVSLADPVDENEVNPTNYIITKAPDAKSSTVKYVTNGQSFSYLGSLAYETDQPAYYDGSLLATGESASLAITGGFNLVGSASAGVSPLTIGPDDFYTVTRVGNTVTVKARAASAGGLRGAPVADLATLTALPAKDFELREAAGNEYVFRFGKAPVDDDVADDAATGAWVKQDLIVGKEYTYFAHTLPDPANGIHAIDGTDIDDQDLADWITANPITGFSVAGSVVSAPDWRGRYLGASGGRGIGADAGELLASVNKAHTHTYQQRSNLGTSSSQTNIFTQLGFQNKTTGSNGGTYARPETVGMPLCVIIGKPQEYVKAADLSNVTDAITAATDAVAAANAATVTAVNDASTTAVADIGTAGDAKIAEIAAIPATNTFDIVHLRNTVLSSINGVNKTVNYNSVAFTSGTGAEKHSSGGILIKADTGIWEIEAVVATQGDSQGSFKIWNSVLNSVEPSANFGMANTDESLVRGGSTTMTATVKPTVDTVYTVRVSIANNMTNTSVDTWSSGYMKARQHSK